MPIVPAGVHAVGSLRGPGLAGGFGDGECVDIGAEGDGAAGLIAAAGDAGGDAGLGDAALEGDAPLGEPRADEVAGEGLLVHDLRVAVEFMTPVGGVLGDGGDAVGAVGHGGAAQRRLYSRGEREIISWATVTSDGQVAKK